ncbi:MAG: SprB repeat-containing protein, partial [Bacteroidia bacterium]|nr:SprB repeat-containing protein [Bacteroidia bacterium]
MQTRLDNVLIQSETYCIEFYVSLTDGIYTDYATSAMGAYFSATAVFANNYDPLPFNPQFSNPSSNFLTNYQGWTKVSGSFVAIGGEQFITIGNFKDNLNSDTLKVFNNNDIQKNSSYYIDDVSVVHLDADAGANKTICTGDSVRLGRSTQSYINYKWRANATLSDSTAAQPYAKPGTTTTYYLTATLTGSGCEKIDSVTVYVSNVSASITADTLLCPGQRGAATVTISTGSAPYTYSWSTGTTAISTNPQMAISNLTVGNYSVNIIDAFGCSTTTSVTFTNLPAPTASITTSKTTLTEGDSTVLTASPAA